MSYQETSNMLFCGQQNLDDYNLAYLDVTASMRLIE